MRKVVGILLLCLMMMVNCSFATEPVTPEEQEGSTSDIDILPISEVPMENNENIIFEDVFKMEDQTIITDVIDGNVYIMAKNAKIDHATIYGNVYVMAQKVEIADSDIAGSIYAMAEEINFSGMANDIYACGSKINLELESYVWRSAKLVGESINIDGNVGRNLYAGVNQLTVGENAVIEGALNYASRNKGNISAQAKIQSINFEEEQYEENEEEPVMNYVYNVLGVIFQTLIVALIVVFLVSKFKELKRTDNVAGDLLKSTGKGALVLIFVPIISILFMFSIVGIGFGFILLVLYLILFYVAIPMASLEIAYRILMKKQNGEIRKGAMIGISILCALIIWIMRFIPVVGGIIRFIVILIGFGIIGSLIFQRNKKEEVNEN